uniref:Uncharacterized protein n=1 Tax=Meloidogyne incognita TaxID=6306 RepID=A0A914L924_MELIC
MNNKHLIYFFIILFPSPDFLFSFFTAGFECFVCNTNSDNDDTEPCIEKIEECPAGPPGTQSCSTLLYFSKRGTPGRPHMRKFCTSPGLGIGLGKYELNEEKNAGICQSVEQWLLSQIDHQSPPNPAPLNSFSKNQLPFKNHLKQSKLNLPKRIIFNDDKLESLERRKRSNNNNDIIGRDGSPSPPQSHSSTLLCICNKQLCNEGDFEQILENSHNNIGIKNKNNKFNIEEE